jgi:RimJ/RimL family protein N-acetyltransferase
VELRTPRLLLRGWREEDVAPFARINADPEVMRYVGVPLDRSETQAYVAEIRRHWAERGYGLWAVERLDEGRLIGCLGLGHHRWYPGEVELGWRLEQGSWNRGLATEAATAALEDAFARVGLDRLITVIHRDNAASRRVAEKCGFRLEKEEARVYERTGETLPIVVYGRSRPSSGPGRP